MNATGIRGVAVFPVRTPTLPPATHTNAWVLGERDVTVIDPASPWVEEQVALATALGDLTVARIVLTHHHLDHVGGAEDLRRRTGAPIFGHRETAARVSFALDGFLDEGDMIETDAGSWRVLHTPGHATGHLALHDPETGTVVAGDLVAGEGTIVLDPPEGHLKTYLASLARIQGLGPTTLLPAHGPALGEAILGQYIAHRHSRTAQIRAALQEAGEAAPDDLVPVVYPTLVEFMRPVAARQILCHLVWLVDQEGAAEVGHGRYAAR